MLCTFRQPEKQELPYGRNGKRIKLAENCVSGANPKCPQNYRAEEQTLVHKKIADAAAVAAARQQPR
jgi:hypothetical protein